MNIKKKFGIGAAGLMALGGSMFGLTLISGAAGASSTLPTSASVTASADQGLNVQDGSQTGVDATSTGASEGVSFTFCTMSRRADRFSLVTGIG